MKARLLALGGLGAFGVALSVLYACSSSSSGSPSNPSTTAPVSCTSLGTCCLALPATEQASCLSVAGGGSDTACSSLLSSYSAVGACSPSIQFDGGIPAHDGGLTARDATSPSLDAGPFSGPSCPATTNSTSVDCQKCTTNCQSQYSFVSDCEAYYACFCPCAANDTGCQQACVPLEGDCMDVVDEVSSCVASDCASLCSPQGTDAGMVTPGDAGACGNLLHCCDTVVEAGVLGNVDAAVCAALVAQAAADGGQAGCEAELTSSPLSAACKTTP